MRDRQINRQLKGIKSKILLVSLALITLCSCSENAHLNRKTPTDGNPPAPQKTGGTPTEESPINTIAIELSGLDGSQNSSLVFQGDFNTDATREPLLEKPLKINSLSSQPWEQMHTFFNYSKATKEIKFNKKLWAEAYGKKYTLFDSSRTTVVPENKRSKPEALKLKITEKTNDTIISEKIYNFPIVYRYAIDDEALGSGKVNQIGEIIYPIGLYDGRVIRGLEQVSSKELLYRNLNCGNKFDFIDTSILASRKNFKAEPLAVRQSNSGKWIKIQTPKSGSILEAIGNTLSNSAATFTPVGDYGGECRFKVQGIILTNEFTPQLIDGIKLHLDSIDSSGEAIFGVTVFEAY